MSVFDHPEFDHHEAIHYFDDPDSGLQAIIAVHSTTLGPAAGGCRRWQYLSDAEALTDVLRLSRGMTYKNAVAGLAFGGGKAVILARDNAPKSPELLRAFGTAVDSLGGTYITAEDVGISVADIQHAQERTNYVTGIPKDGETEGGDPSPWTALGVFLGIEAAVKKRLGKDSLEGVSVAVQGVGHVGYNLCRLLDDAGAKIIVADVNRNNLRKIAADANVTEASTTDILFSDVDVLAPCALGNVLNSETIPKLRASVVAGAANNQLSIAADGQRLADRGILYAPDYVINAGGIIRVAREYLGQGSDDEDRAEIARIPERLTQIFEEAENDKRPTNVIADELARRIVERGQKAPWQKSHDSTSRARPQDPVTNRTSAISS